MNVVRIGDEIQLTQNFFGRDSFPFGVAEAGKADELAFDGLKSFAVVENAHAEDAVGSLRCEGG